MARLVKAQPAGSETNHVVRPGEQRLSRDFVQPKNDSGKTFNELSVTGRQSSEKPKKQNNQEVRSDQSGLKSDNVKSIENTSKKLIIEDKKYPAQAQNLREIFSTTQELVLVPKVEVLDKRVAENASLARVKNVVIVNSEKQSMGVQVKIASPAVRNDTTTELQNLPGLKVEVKNALEQAGKNVKVLEKPVQPDVKGAALPASLDLIIDQQFTQTFEALLPALGREMALKAIGQSVEQRVAALNPAQKLALAEKVIAETDPEELLENLPDDEKWRVTILVRKIIQERQIKYKAVVWQPGMRARARKIEQAFGRIESGQVVSGSELVSEIGPQTSDEIGPINPDGYNSGGGDQFRLALMYGEFEKGDLNWVLALSEDHPTLEVAEEEEAASRAATAEEIHEEIHGRLPEIIAFAKQRAIVMLAGLV